MRERLGVLGTGAIGMGLTRHAACFGEVTLWARSAESADRTRAKLEPTDEWTASAPAGVVVTSDLDELQGCSFIVEAVVEDPAAKAALLRQLGKQIADEAVVSTATSSLSVTDLGHAAGLSGRLIGFHPFNPVHKMRLVELVYPEGVEPSTRSRARALCEALEKHAIEVPDVPGFVVNRLLFPYLFSAVHLMQRTGLGADQIDSCMTLGAGMPLGPLGLLDLVGLDVAATIGASLGEPIPDRLKQLVADGRLGRKTGEGFHRYGAQAKPARDT